MNLFQTKAWDVRGKRMVTPTLINVSGKTLSCIVEQTGQGVWTSVYRFDEVEFIVSTGKHDRAQNELYAGDIVTSTEYPFQDDGRYNYHGVIEWDEEDAAFCVRMVLVNPEKSGDLHGMYKSFADIDFEEVEKLGNVYEHPHLLEKQKEDHSC